MTSANQGRVTIRRPVLKHDPDYLGFSIVADRGRLSLQLRRRPFWSRFAMQYRAVRRFGMGPLAAAWRALCMARRL